jgi:hypothetical protein
MKLRYMQARPFTPVYNVNESAVATGIVAGTVTPGTTAGSINATSLKSKFGFVFRARSTNTGKVYIGGPNVSSTVGYMLNAGDSVLVQIEDLMNIFAVASASAQLLDYIGTA